MADDVPFLHFAPYAVRTPIMPNRRYLDGYADLDPREAAYATWSSRWTSRSARCSTRSIAAASRTRRSSSSPATTAAFPPTVVADGRTPTTCP